MLAAVTGGIQAAERLVKGGQRALFRVIGQQGGDVFFVAENVVNKAAQGTFGANFDKQAHTLVIEGFQTFHPLHGRGNLFLQDVFDGGNGRWVHLPRHIGHQRQGRLADAQPVQHLAQRHAGRGDDAGVKRVADRNGHGAVALGFKLGDGLFNGRTRPANHALAVAVDVRRDHVAVDLPQNFLHLFIGSQHGGHFAIVWHVQVGHFAAARRRRFQGIGKRHNPGSDERRIFAQRMPHHHVRLKAIIGQQGHHGHIQRQHGRLANLGLHQVKIGLHHGRRIVGIDKNVFGQVFAQNGLHHGVGFGKDLGHRRREFGQFAPHVGVLAALAGEQEGDFALGPAAAAKNTLRLDCFPGLRVVETHHFTRFLQAIQQFVVVAVVDDEALRGLDNGRVRQCGHRRHPAISYMRQCLIQFFLKG